jgi:hypothetical protein
MHDQPLSLYLPSLAKLWCTLRLRGQIHSPYFSSTPVCTLWCTLSDILGKLCAKEGFSIANNIKQRCGVRLKHIRFQPSLIVPWKCWSCANYTVKKGYRFSLPQPGCHSPNSPWPGIIKFFLARESLLSDIPAGDGKTTNLFYSVVLFVAG